MAKQGIYAEIGLSSEQAEGALRQVQQLAKATTLSLNELLKTTKQSGQTFNNAGNNVDRYGRKMTDGEKQLRGWYREQRLQDRTMREMVGTVSQLTFAFAFLNQGQEEVGSTTSKVTKTLMQGVMAQQAAEFGFFALGMAGERMGGKLGKVFQGIGKLAMPLSMVAGGIAGIVSWISIADEKMTQWTNAGIANMTKALIAAAGGRTSLLEKAVSMFEGERGTALARAQVGARALLNVQPVIGHIPGASYKIPTEEQAAQTRIDAMKQQAISDYANSAEGILSTVELEVKDRTDIIKKIRDAIREQEIMVEFENRANKILKENGSEFVKQQVRLQEIGKSLQFDSLTQAQRRKLLDEQAKIQQTIVQQNKTSLDLAVERTSRAKMMVEMGMKESDYLEDALKAQRQITDDAEKRLAIDKAIFDIHDAERKARVQLLDMVSGMGVSGMVAQPEQQAVAAENLRYNQAKRQIVELGALKRDVNGNVIKWTEEADDALAQNEALHIINNAELKRLEEEKTQARMLEGLDQLAAGMANIFRGMSDRTGQIFGQFLKMLQVWVQISKFINAANAPGGGGMGDPGNILSVLGMIFGLFDKGGYTGSGSRYQPAGIVHRGEVVFEKPLVDRYGGELMAMRANMQRGYSVGGFVGSGRGGMMGGNIVVTGTVDIDNGMLFLRRYSPGLDKWNKKKIIG